MRWGLRSTIGSIVLIALVVGILASRTRGFSVFGLVGSLATTAIAVGLAGVTHHFAHRLIARRPWGTYFYGVLIGESYLFCVLGTLTVARWFGAPGLTRPGQEDWRHWPEVAVSGVLVGLVWGFLSRNEV